MTIRLLHITVLDWFSFVSVPIQFEPMLPGYKREMLKHMPIGSYLKFIFVFDKVLVELN